MSIWQDLTGAALGGIQGFAAGGLVGAAAGAARGAAQARAARTAAKRTTTIRGGPIVAQPSVPGFTGGGFASPVIPAAGQAAGRVAARVLPGIGRAARRTFPGLFGGAAAGVVLDQFGRPIRLRRRRMNPANVKALNRAVRRVNASLNLLKRIEKLQKRVHPPRRARVVRAPIGHRARLTHTE